MLKKILFEFMFNRFCLNRIQIKIELKDLRNNEKKKLRDWFGELWDELLYKIWSIYR